MKKLILLSILSFCVYSLNAQRKFPALGQVGKEELLLPSCNFEPGANAMKLFDLQEIDIETDGYSIWLETRKRVRIKLFNEKGYPFASVQIPYFNIERSTRIEDLEGYVYNLDEKGEITITKLDKNEFYKDISRENLNLINFTFPALKPGSVIEFSYRKIEQNIIEIDPWIIQDEIPVDVASCIVHIPGYSGITEKITGTDTITTSTEKVFFGVDGKIKKTYYKEKIPSFKPEPLMSSLNDNLLRLLFHYTIRPNPAEPEKNEPDYLWAMFGSRFLHILNTELDLKRDIPGTDAIVNNAKIIRSTAERISYIYDAVKKQFPGKRSPELYPEDIRKAWASREGNAADINLVLLNLLRKSGIEAHPLLVSTKEHGKINTQFPGSGQLNALYILVHDADTYYVMDANQEIQSPFVPPANVLFRKGLLLKKNSYKWIDIIDSRPLLKYAIWINGLLDNEGNLQGIARNTFYDYAKTFISDSSHNQATRLNAFTQGIITDSVKYENTGQSNDPLIQQLNFHYPLNNSGDYYFLNPQLYGAVAGNPFKESNRLTDIDFGCNQELVLQLNIEVPESYTPDFLPTSLIIRAPDSSFLFRRSVKFDKGRLIYYQKFEISQPVFDKEQYPGIKEFFDRVYALMAEEIVLKKKK